jgi:hypothetical protein
MRLGYYGPLKQSAVGQKHCGEAIGHWDSGYMNTANRREGQLA